MASSGADSGTASWNVGSRKAGVRLVERKPGSSAPLVAILPTMAKLSTDEIFAKFLEWKAWYCGKINATYRAAGCNADEIFDEILSYVVPAIQRRCETRKDLTRFVCGPMSDHYIVAANRRLDFRQGRKRLEYNEVDLCKREDKENRDLTLFITPDYAFENLLVVEENDFWCWVLYRSLPKYRPWLEGYLVCGTQKDLATYLNLSRQRVHQIFSQFYKDARFIVETRTPPFGFHETFTKKDICRGGICQCCGKPLDIMADEYCNEKCRKKGPHIQTVNRRWGKYFSSQSVRNIKKKSPKAEPKTTACKVYKVINGELTRCKTR